MNHLEAWKCTGGDLLIVLAYCGVPFFFTLTGYGMAKLNDSQYDSEGFLSFATIMGFICMVISNLISAGVIK